MKAQRRDLVLAFYPHARGFAYVVFEGPHSPVDWGMSDVAGKRKAHRALRRLELLLDRYKLDAVVLRGVGDGARYAKLLRTASELVESRGLQVASFRRRQIREAFAYLGSPTRYAIAEAIAHHLSALSAFQPPRRKIWNGEDRRMGLFDAASLGLTFFQSWYVMDG